MAWRHTISAFSASVWRKENNISVDVQFFGIERIVNQNSLRQSASRHRPPTFKRTFLQLGFNLFNRMTIFHFRRMLPALLSLFLSITWSRGADNGDRIVTLNTPRSFPKVSDAGEWNRRAEKIRQQILVSCGLWPMPEPPRLVANEFETIKREGYSVSKVYFRTAPGFYLAGNLYRPSNQGNGPFPAVLNPHGHWQQGRLADTPEGSIPARCIAFARQGYIAFSYDMVGFNDSQFANSPTNLPFYNVHRLLDTNREAILWNINSMGLQTWNSIQALSFLSSLPEVDCGRIACTGESGGGTQTFMLGAVDRRLAAQAPVVMVSHTMQGGCSCENAPGLRVEYSNMEFAAAAAPRPQMLIAATGDWTKTTLTYEGPAIAAIYNLLGKNDNFSFKRFDYNHNYNLTSREAVYAWLGKILLKEKDPEFFKEKPYQKEPDEDLRVFSRRAPPGDRFTLDQYIQSQKEQRRQRWLSQLPNDKQRGLGDFKRVWLPAWSCTLQLNHSFAPAIVEAKSLSRSSFSAYEVKIARPGIPHPILATYGVPAHKKKDGTTLVISMASGEKENQDGVAAFNPFETECLHAGYGVLAIKKFSGDVTAEPFTNFFTTYNLTQCQERVGDISEIIRAVAQLPGAKAKPRKIFLSGEGVSGLWALLASPLADGVIADANQLDSADEKALLAPNVLCPGVLNLGGFEGVTLLAAPHPALIHNTGAAFQTRQLKSSYQRLSAEKNCHVSNSKMSAADLVQWLKKHG
jgi:dienelactone hydrolase